MSAPAFRIDYLIRYAPGDDASARIEVITDWWMMTFAATSPTTTGVEWLGEGRALDERLRSHLAEAIRAALDGERGQISVGAL